jgi:hypothetical protein
MNKILQDLNKNKDRIKKMVYLQRLKTNKNCCQKKRKKKQTNKNYKDYKD